ncbi:MAG: class I SAM-dependent methyltransferase [Candidatus Thorarchaeota archaeon]|nr:class I SAM-dependent methyltransferase [Candidatus Thorarchaeota archaeon]
MLSTIGAWAEIIWLLTSKDRVKMVHEYHQALSVNAMRREGWFDYMRMPQTVEDLMDHFGYTDFPYLMKFLDAFVHDGILIRENGTYRTNGPIAEYPINPPDIFNAGILQVHADALNAVPNRLKGVYTTFSDEMNTFNWDDTLQLKMYDKIRKAAFRFTDALKRSGTFLDVGCGNGVGTAAIWGYYYKKGVFTSNNPVKIYGLEYDPNLMQIADAEFAISASRLLGVDRSVIDALKEHHPVFVQGNAEELPFEDEFFDMVYTSQVLHWCDAKKATQDILRVLKPGGLFFGTEAFYPILDPHIELFILLNEGAYGAIKKEDFFQWAKEAGASTAKSATPAGVFKVVKN